MEKLTFEEAEEKSARLGQRYAEHIHPMGASMTGFTIEQERRLTNLFRQRVQETWRRTNSNPLTDAELDSLEETFCRNFGSTLGTLAGC